MQTENNEGKVVSLFGRTEKSAAKSTEVKSEDQDFDFETIMKQNASNRNRQDKDRKKANRGVVRSYRLKH